SSAYNLVLIDISILIMRVSVSALMIVHGKQKFNKLITTEDISFQDPLGIGEVPSLILVVFAELVCSILVIIGLATRLALVPLIITMIIAAVVIHGNHAFGEQELPYLYLIIYTALFFTGPGKFSLDRVISKK